MRSAVTVRVRGLMLEKLLMRAGEEGAAFHAVRRLNDREMELDAPPASARILLHLAERYSMPAEVVRRRGMAAWIHAAKSRATLALAPFAAAAVLLLLLSRIWSVEISAASGALPDGGADIRAYLAENGVAPGCSLSEIDEGLLSARIASECPGYTFVSVRQDGVRLLISVVPEEPEPGVYDSTVPSHIVASRDGIVEEITVLAGRAAVKPGQLVRAGDVLIYGEERISDEACRPVAASGRVTARTWAEGSASSPLSYPARVATGRGSVSYALNLFTYRMEPDGGEEYYCSEEEITRIPVVGLFLPLTLEKTVRRELECIPRELNPDQLIYSLSCAARLDAASRLNGCAIRDSWTRVQQEDGQITVRAVIEAVADIATPRPQSTGG